jgi:amino-acid N-acetyltransferase
MNSHLPISARPGYEATIRILREADLPTEDIGTAHLEHFSYVGPATEPTGLVGLEIFGDVALLRSLVVVPSRRGSGDGQRLLSHAEEQAKASGVRELYLLTTTAETFFAKRGFERASRDSAPPAIRSTREFSGICPASSAFMSKRL